MAAFRHFRPLNPHLCWLNPHEIQNITNWCFTWGLRSLNPTCFCFNLMILLATCFCFTFWPNLGHSTVARCTLAHDQFHWGKSCRVLFVVTTSPYLLVKSPLYIDIYIYILVDGWPTPLKNISQMGVVFPIYGKIKNVPNHQPVYRYRIPFTPILVVLSLPVKLPGLGLWRFFVSQDLMVYHHVPPLNGDLWYHPWLK